VVYYLCFGHYDYQFSTITILSTKPTTAIKKFKTRQAAVSKHPSHKLDRFGQCNAMEMEAFSTRPSPVAAGRGEMGACDRGGTVQGRHLEGRKYRILEFGGFWRTDACIAERIRWEFALSNTP